MIEVNAPDKPTRRRRGKTDTLDAEAAARAVLSGRASGSAKTGDGPVDMLRMLKLAKDSATKARSQTINQLKAVLVAADPVLREALSGLTTTMLVRRCAQLPATTPADVTSTAIYTLRLLARRILGTDHRNLRPCPPHHRHDHQTLPEEIRPHRVDRDGELCVLAGLAQRAGLCLVPDDVLRARTTGPHQLLNARSDLSDLDVGEIISTGATLDGGGLIDIDIDDGFSHVGGFPTNLRGDAR